MLSSANRRAGWCRTTDLNSSLNEAIKGGLRLLPEEATAVLEASAYVLSGQVSTVVVPIGVYGGHVEHNNRLASGVVIVSLNRAGNDVTFQHCSFGLMYPEVG